MKANAVSLLAIFESKLQLEVPLFQRQYVWKQSEHWEPLWEDIARKFSEYLEGRRDAPVHFLGAMVLDQKQVPVTHVAKRQVIDGQQRLTTFQLFLAAFRDFSRAQGCEAIAKECQLYTVNSGMMANPKVDPFKVWPTQLDRDQYRDVMTAESREALEQRHPLRRRKYVKKPEPRARMVEAYIFFYDQLSEYFMGKDGEAPLMAEHAVQDRLAECLQALRNALQVVAIDLEQGDDAQVIFETLNARGEPLLPADLLRNDIFLRAARQGESQETLYDTYWTKFDDAFWRQEVKQGRLLRPRSDLFLQHYLASQRGEDIPVKHLFVEYKHWLTKHPFKSVADELAMLMRQSADFRRILAPDKSDPIYRLSTFLDTFDIRTSYPLLLAMFEANLSAEAWAVVTDQLESYLVRRAVCGLTTKNYNRIFLTLTRNLRRDGVDPEVLRNHLLGLTGDSSEWPTDAQFRDKWRTVPAYQILSSGRAQYILHQISNALIGAKMEDVVLNTPITVEHIMPQSWQDHWPLPEGRPGLADPELEEAHDNDPVAQATADRNAAVQRFGNLTIITQTSNSSLSNDPWAEKRSKLLTFSLLPINHLLARWDTWDESTIAERGDLLFETALRLWPRG